MAHHFREYMDLLDETRSKIREAYINAVTTKLTAVQIGVMQDLIDRGDIEGAVAMLKLDNSLIDDVVDEIRIAYRKSGQMAVEDLRPPPDIRKVRSAAFTFAVLGNPRAEQWLLEQSSRLIVEVVEQQRTLVRSVISESLGRGRNPRDVAIQVTGRLNRKTRKREGGIVGLWSGQERWIENAQAELDNGQFAEYLSRRLRDRRFDRTVIKHMKAKTPIPLETRKKMILAYRARALKYRGEVIGRTESLRSVNAAKLEGMEQVVENGGIKNRQNAKHEWQATLGSVRTRDTHKAAHGQVRQIDEYFDIGGFPMRYPGDPNGPPQESIQCRCTTISVVNWAAEALLQ